MMVRRVGRPVKQPHPGRALGIKHGRMQKKDGAQRLHFKVLAATKTVRKESGDDVNSTNCLRDGQMVELPPLEDQDCCVHRAGLRFSIPQISSCIMEPRRKKIKLKINRSSYQDYRHWDFG